MGDYLRVGVEAGPLSQWLCFGLKDAGLPVVCIEARHAKAAMGAMNRNKNDRNDARSLAQLVRSGWFKAVHVKLRPSQELRTLLTAREFYVNKLRNHENEIRGLLRPFGLKVGKVGRVTSRREHENWLPAIRSSNCAPIHYWPGGRR